MMVSLDYLGENVSSTADAQHARDAYLEVFDKIAEQRLHANVSCKLTALGMDLSAEFCEGPGAFDCGARGGHGEFSCAWTWKAPPTRSERLIW